MATTAVLAIGFLSMLSSGLVAIRDMGLVATVTLLTALFADLVLLPAQIILVRRIRGAWARAGRAPEPC
jgi:predicted RND superfamily exporter protein